ncbi:MAG: sulfotransferase family 2 domain-containing protein [Arenibacterium sp.]
MVVSVKSHGVAYWPVPKAGCSSVKAMLAQIDPDYETKAQEYTENHLHKVYQTRPFKQVRFDAHESDFRFTVLRDPIRRLMSVYTNRVVQKRDLENRRLTMERSNLPVYPSPDTFFLNLKAYCKASSRILHHAKYSGYFCGYQLDKYDRVYRTDEMEVLARDLSDVSGRKVKTGRENASSMTLEFNDLREKTRDTIRPFLEKEYRHLSGYFENPFA